MLPNFNNDIQNPLIDSLRKKIEDEYGVDTSEISNEQLLFKHGQDLQNNAGYTMSKMRGEYGDEFTDQYFDIKNRPRPDQGYLDEIGSGFKEQGYGLLGMPFQAAGLAAGAVGDTLGVDLGVEDYLMETGSNIAAKGQADPRTIQSIDDVRFDNPAEIARFLLGGIGAAAPSVAESATVFTGAGGVGYAIAKSRAKKALAGTIKNRASGETADQAVKNVFQELVKRQAKKGFNTGAQIGLGVSSIGLGVGEIYGELYRYTQLDPNDPDYVNPTTARALSASFGTVAGSLDMLSAGRLLSRMTGATAERSTGYLKRLLRALPEGIILEGGTEVAQEFLNLAAEKYAKGEEIELTDQELMRMLDAGILGAIGGTGFSALGAIPGPKKPPEPEAQSQDIASESAEVRAQKDLLQEIKQDSPNVRYKKGEKVQTAYGEKGVVKEARAEESTVEMEDGTVREIRNDRLAEAFTPPAVDPEPVATPEKTDQPQAEATEVVPDTEEAVIQPHEDPAPEEVFEELEGLDGSVIKVTPETKADIKKLLKYYRSWQKEDMYTMKGRAGMSGKGWDSSNFNMVEIKLGPDRALIRGKRGDRNKAALNALGYLDNNGNWYKETPADRTFVKEQNKALKDGRLKVIADNKEWLAPGKKVKNLKGKPLGVIDELTKDGYIKIGDEEYNPRHLYSDEEKIKSRRSQTASPPAGGGGTRVSPEDVSDLNFMEADLDLKDKEVEYFYLMTNGRISQTTKKPGKFKDMDALKTGLIEMFAKEKVKNKSSVGNALKIAVGPEQFQIFHDADNGGYDFGAFTITESEIKKQVVKNKGGGGGEKFPDYVQRAGELKLPIDTQGGRPGGSDYFYPGTVFNENGDTPLSMFTGEVDTNDVIGEDGSVRRDTYDEGDEVLRRSAGKYIDQISKSRVLLILKNGNQLRIVSVGLKNTQVRVYDATRAGKPLSRYIDLYGMKDQGWNVVGKLLTNKAIKNADGKDTFASTPYIDVIYQDTEEFNSDAFLIEAMEQVDAGEKDSKQAARTKQVVKERKDNKANNAEIKKSVLESIAEIERQLKNDEGDVQGAALPPEDQDGKPKATREELLAQLEQLKQQLAYLDQQDEADDLAIRTEQAKYQQTVKGQALQANAIREGSKKEGEGQGFTTSEAMLKNTNVGDVSKIWTAYLHTLSLAKFEYILDFNNTRPPGGSKRAKNQVEIFESVGRASGAKEFFGLVTDMLGGAETGRKDLLKAYADSGTLFDKFLTALYQRLLNDNATKAYVKDKEIVTDPMADPELAKKLRGLLERYFKGRQDVILKTVDAMAYDQARRGDDVDVYMQEPPVPQQTPEPTPEPEEEAPPSQREIRLEKFQQLKDTLKAYDLPIDVGLFRGLMKADLGPAINKSPDEVYEAALDEIIYNLGIENELEGADRSSFMEFFKNRTSIEDIVLMFDQGGSRIREADTQGLELNEGYEVPHSNVDEARLNPNRSSVPIIDPTTGQREITQTGTTSNEAIDHSYEEARRDPRRYMAPKENPVSKHPGRVEEAQAAMRRFAPMDGPFPAKVAINQIIDQFPHLGYISNVGRMLTDNKFLDGYTVQLLPWEQYRPYANVNGVLTRAVHIRSKKRIIISDAYYGINETLKSDEALAAVILHELLHPALNPVLDIVLELQGSGEITTEVDAKTKEMATSLHSSMEKLMPYLKERAAGDLKLQYGLTSVDEFFSVFAADPYFRDFLSRTPLPESMRKTGVMQTILDFIYRILAKLNFATAQTDTALDYATEQMSELIEKSNSLSHALDTNGNRIQASALDPNREKLSASEGAKQRQKEKKLYRQKVDELRADAADSFSRILLGKKLSVPIVNAELGPMVYANREITKTLIKRISENPSLIEIENNNSPEVLKVLKVVETYKSSLEKIQTQGSNIQGSALDPEYQADVTIPEGAGDLFMELANEAMQVESLSDSEVFGVPFVRSSNFTSQGSGNNLFYLPKDVLVNPQRTAQLKKQLKETAKRLDERFNLGVFESTLKRRQEEGFKGGLFNEVQAMRAIYYAIKNPPKKDIQGSALDSEYQDSLSSDEKNHLGKGFKGDKILFYDEILDEISRGSTQEQQEIIRAINVSRTGTAVRDGGLELQKTTTLRSDEERRTLLEEFAKASGRLVDRNQFDAELAWGSVLSGEHKVYFNDEQQRYFKEYPAVNRVDFDKYLERLLLHNYLFPEVAYKFEGLIEVDAESFRQMRVDRPFRFQEGFKGYDASLPGFNIVISQAAYGEQRPPPQMINDYMLGRGFRMGKQGGFQEVELDREMGVAQRQEYGGYQRGDIIVRDLGPKNSRMVDGRFMPFDPIIEQGLQPQMGRLKVKLDEIQDTYRKTGGYKGLSKSQINQEIENVLAEIRNIDDRDFDMQASALFQDESQGDFDPNVTADPDDNMRVMMESNAAGFNELVNEIVKIYQEMGGEKLGMDLESFMNIYGSPGTTNMSTIKKRLERDLKPFTDSIEDIRLDNAGLNRVAFNWGRKKGVQNLEAVRTKARKELQDKILAEEMSEKAIIASQRTYEDLKNGRFPPIIKQVEAILKKANTVSFDILKEYVTSLPNASITQEDIRAVQDLSKTEIEQVMELLIQIPGEAETLKKGELMDEIKKLGIDSLSGDNKTHAVKRMAIMRAVRESKGQMALYRLSKGKIGGDQKEMLKVGKQIATATDLKTLNNIVIRPGVKGTPFRHFAKLKEAEINEQENLKTLKKEQELFSKLDLGLKVRSDVLRASLGELQPVSIHDGASILTMEWDDKNAQWNRGKNFQVQIKNGKLVNRAQFVKVNRETLRFINDPESKKEFGNEIWYDLMREQALLAMAEPIGEEYFHVQRATWISGLQGLTERFSKLGYDGMKLSQMSSQTVALFRDYSSKSQSFALQFNASAQRLMGALKVGGREFYSGIYQDIWWWYDNHPEFADQEEKAFAELWKYLRKGANISDRTLLDDNARRLTKDLVAKTIAARDFEKRVNMELGNRIKDDDFKVQSYIDGELVDFYRAPMDIGYATLPRSINNAMVGDTNKMMQDAGWRGEAANELIAEAESASDLDTISKIYSRMFTEEVVAKFLKPFVHSDVRQSVFRGPVDQDGHHPYIGNSFIREAFRASKGDVFAMTDIIFDRVSNDTTLKARLEWKYYFLRQVDNKYLQLKKVADKLMSDKVEQGLQDSHLMRNTPQSLDSRMMESRLPKEFFYYTMYDEVTSSIRLALQVATKTFGRQGDKANRAFKGGRLSFEEARDTFNKLMNKATAGKHDDAPWKHYSREVKKEAYRLLRLDGDSNPEKTWNELYSKSVALGEMNRAMEHLARYYGKDNAAGPYKDANLLLELLGVQALSVLNNPKSSFWQNLGLFEFPMAFRGLNKMAGKGTAAALGNFVNQTFGGMVESMGVELNKTSRYAQYLNNTHFRLDEMDLDFKTYVGAQLGSGGELAGHEPRKYLRMVKRAMMFNKRKNVDGTRAPFDWLTVIKGIFPYINNVVNHSVGVGAIHAYNDLIIQASEEIQRRGIIEYNGELTAQDLGMGDKVGETFIGEADGYRRMNELLISHGLPSVTRMAFDFIDRKKIDKNAFPIDRNQALLINTIAMDQISGDGFNAKPAWLYSNEYLRYFNTFLGWPLGKMGRDLTAVIRDSDDPTTTYMALLKYMGLLTAVYMPMSLSFGMMIDWYDEEMLEKPNNLPPITPWAALPLVGIPIAASDPNFTIYSVTARLAKAGVPFGMGTELLNGIFSKGDPYGASRELSLDSRIFMFSMFKNIYDAMGTWIHQGEWDWETVGRPIAYGVGGNSVIQMMDLTTAKLDIDSEERRVADYIGLKNTIKKTAFMMGLELRPPFKGGGRPTGVSVNTRQMARAAYAGDSQGFLEQYQEALQAAREAGKTDPEQSVIDSYKRRSLRTGVTKTVMTDAEWSLLMSVLSEEDRAKVMNAVSAHEHYLRLIGGTRRVQSINRTIDLEQARVLAASLLVQ